MSNLKVNLIVKNGPGEIVGVTELDLIDGKVEFNGISFTEAGEYTISAVPSNKNYETLEFNINVLPEPDIIPQENEATNEEIPEPSGSRPIISQIDKPSINLEPITLDTTGDNILTEDIKTAIGFTPFLWYNGYQIQENYIKRLELYYEDYVPKISVSFIDSMDILKTPRYAPTVNTRIELFMSSNSDFLKSIHLRFKIEESQISRKNTYIIRGTLDLKDFYNIGYSSYEGTSFNVLRKLTSEYELGFNSNINNTVDSMTWRRTGVLTKDFIDNIIKHSYISDESYIIGYIDFYWCFNYVDIEKEWDRDISNDLGINTTGFGGVGSEEDSKKLVSLELTNDPSFNGSNLFFSSFKINNNSTSLINREGNYTISKVYDRTNKQFLKFDIDSISKEKGDNLILKESGESRDNNYRSSYRGKIDMSNVHSNYIYAYEQNLRNYKSMMNVTMDIQLPNINYNLYRFQKIKINFINLSTNTVNPNRIDERLTGEWMIVDIRISWKRGRLLQLIKVTRKDLGKIKEEIENQVTTNPEVNNSEINDNPIEVGINAPLNDSFRVGSSYNFISSDNIEYNLLVIDLDGDSNIIVDITGNGVTNTNIVFSVLSEDKIINSTFGELKLKSGNNGFNFGDLRENLSELDQQYIESPFMGEDEIFTIDIDGEVDTNQEYLNYIKSGSSEPEPTPPGDYIIPENKKPNIDTIIKYMKEGGIINKYTQASILAIVSKETNFTPRDESSYSNTSSSRIKKIFSVFKDYTIEQIDVIKQDEKQFFDIIYGGRYGNNASEGWKYRGRGFNQLTFKGNYQKTSQRLGVDLVQNPDNLNNIDIASRALVQYFQDRFKKITEESKLRYNTSGDLNDFTDLQDAAKAIYHANAGWGKSMSTIEADSTGGRRKALSRVSSFYDYIVQNS